MGMTEFTLVVHVREDAAEAFRTGMLAARESEDIGLAVEQAIGNKLADVFGEAVPHPYGEGIVEVGPGEGFA
jgi:hypothetical protein